jgi:hypothetical protein
LTINATASAESGSATVAAPWIRLNMGPVMMLEAVSQAVRASAAWSAMGFSAWLFCSEQ